MAKPAEVAKRAREITAKKTALLRAAVEKRRSQTKEIPMKQDDVVEAVAIAMFQLDTGSPEDFPEEWAGAKDAYIGDAEYVLQTALSAQPIQQDDVVEAANTSRCTLASEALFMARHRLSKEGFGPDDPTIKAINDGIAALSAQHSDLGEGWKCVSDPNPVNGGIFESGDFLLIPSSGSGPAAIVSGDHKDTILTALRPNRAAIIEECAKVAECEAMWGTDKQGLRERIAKQIRSLNGGDHV